MGFQDVEKLATGNFFEDYVVKIIHLRGAFFLEKSAPHPCKKAPYIGVFRLLRKSAQGAALRTCKPLKRLDLNFKFDFFDALRLRE